MNGYEIFLGFRFMGCESLLAGIRLLGLFKSTLIILGFIVLLDHEFLDYICCSLYYTLCKCCWHLSIYWFYLLTCESL